VWISFRQIYIYIYTQYTHISSHMSFAAHPTILRAERSAVSPCVIGVFVSYIYPQQRWLEDMFSIVYRWVFFTTTNPRSSSVVYCQVGTPIFVVIGGWLRLQIGDGPHTIAVLMGPMIYWKICGIWGCHIFRQPRCIVILYIYIYNIIIIFIYIIVSPFCWWKLRFLGDFSTPYEVLYLIIPRTFAG